MGKAASITEAWDHDPAEPNLLSPAVRGALMVGLSIGSAIMLSAFAVVAVLALLN